jgi:hypothetical protein
MQRKQPSHILKIYEALWCIGDSRLQLVPSEDGVISAQVISSDRSKIYTVSYRQSDQSIMSNDNSSYRNSEVWYPSLALLLFLDVLDYQSEYGEALSGISWKTINMENNNNRSLTQQQVDEKLVLQGIDSDTLHQYCEMLLHTLWSLWLQYLWEKKQPVK